MGRYRFTSTADGRWQTTAVFNVGGQEQELLVTLDADGYKHLNARGCTCRMVTRGLEGVILGGVDDCRIHGFPRRRVAPPRHRTRRGPARRCIPLFGHSSKEQVYG